jgi:FixJ family two-component response regulator
MGTGQDGIAIVDDDTGVRDSLRCLLEVTGHRVETYGSGAEFLAQADPRHLACLIVDQLMPHVTGLRLIEQLRRNGIGLPAVLITGGPADGLTKRAAELGVKMLEKPLLVNDILDWAAAAETGRPDFQPMPAPT